MQVNKLVCHVPSSVLNAWRTLEENSLACFPAGSDSEVCIEKKSNVGVISFTVNKGCEMTLLKLNNTLAICKPTDDDVEQRSNKEDSVEHQEACVKHRFVCPGCESDFPFPSNLFLHIRKAHDQRPELLKEAEAQTAVEHSSGAAVTCITCGAVRHGKAILRHFEIFHSDLHQYSVLFKEVKALYLAAGRHSRLQARRERNKQNRILKQEALSVQIENIKTKISSDLISTFCLFCYAADFTCTQQLAEHVETEHELLWAEYHQMTVDYSNLTQSSGLNSDLERKYTRDYCGLCGKRLNEPRMSIARHLKAHNMKKAEYQQLLLKDCAARKAHFSEKRFVKNYSCPLCAVGFTMMNNLRAHVRTKHKNSRDAILRLEELQASLRKGIISVQCIVCGKNRNGASVISHMKITHSHVADFESLLQETVKIFQRARRQSAKGRLQGKQFFACKFCNSQQFLSRTSRLRHQISCSRNPHSRRLIRCKKCSYWTQDAARMDGHTKRRHSQPSHDDVHVCHLCGKAYKRSTGLLVHLGCVHGVTKRGPARTYVCPYCGKQFMYCKRRYDCHIATHSVERNFVCSQCSKSFKTAHGLRAHVRTCHESTYPFYCERCGHGVNNKRHLESHVCGRVRRQSIVDPSTMSVPTIDSSLLDLLTDHNSEGSGLVVMPDTSRYDVPHKPHQHYSDHSEYYNCPIE
ncbi:hypothetical protein CAPTEDRAFT_209688 [Capitella teleta]|uniref:C2H2-type domain-containing protein n=1 Tax=Capitella teleta TaxID=283909 RepID=R7UVZ6_CAPTE|nr:hypothetical protein CAPTEDRAFT_209688 [Capitella teleta]|eukprot:ELU10442.1 hypothetical protein CAPTEDRAFT_209688 [Capitella teleta]